MKAEHCEMKKHMTNLNLYNARLRFKIRAHMTPSVQMNFKNDPVFKANLWTCSGCDRRGKDRLTPPSQDTQAHILTCVGYADLRKDKDLNDDKDLVEYFSAVIMKRMNLSE